jgi:hypothetical protein
MEAVFAVISSGMVTSDYREYGPIGTVFALMSYPIAIGVVVIFLSPRHDEGGPIRLPLRKRKVRWDHLTATVTATTAAASAPTQPSTATYSHTFGLSWASAPAEKRTVRAFYRGGCATVHEFAVAQASAASRRSKITPVLASVYAIRSSDQTCAASSLTLA